MKINALMKSGELIGGVVCFYAYPGLAGDIVRADTRRPGQPWADVPSHCAVVLPIQWTGVDGTIPMLFEFIASGWHARLATEADFAWSVPISLPDMAAATRSAVSGKGRYAWWVIGLAALARFVPDRWIPEILHDLHLQFKHICSVYAEDVASDGGYDWPHWLIGQDAPPSPNDIWCALRPVSVPISA